ncbi:MAG: zinc ribbon domain-containing protein [Clostridia bacterium]|nr:zinc ribbon domain-containing protein [Clostridia bacterium]
MADLKKCPNCGRIYPGRYKFCPECGADLRTAGASPRPTEEEGKSDLISREAALAILHECGGDEITPPNMIEMRGRMYKILAVDAVEVSADELKHLINDTIAYIWRMEDSGRNKPVFG